MADFQDRTLACGECGQDFIFEAREQSFFADKGFGDPKRCPNCRAKKKNERRDMRQFTKVTCAKCGMETEVPFVPREGGRPVYCRDCFASMKQAA